MIYKAGIEQVEPGKWMIWMFDLPGCYCKGVSRSEIIASAPQAIAEYLNWREGYAQVEEADISHIQVEIVEEFKNYYYENDYWVNAFYDDDKRLLTEADIDQAVWLLSCTRTDLENVIRKIPFKRIRENIEGEVFKSLEGIINHIAGAEWWYFDRLDLACDWDELPENVLEKLSVVRHHTIKQLPRLINNPLITRKRDELWSARKIVRRTLWHERVHTRHLQDRLINM